MLRSLGLVISLSCFSIVSCSSVERVSEPKLVETDMAWNCESGNEFLVASEYLRDSQKTNITSAEISQIAIQVSEGCTGAANRFIKVVRLLSKAGLGMKDTITIAVSGAKQSDASVDTFISTFKLSFRKEGLDLTLNKALIIAQQVSLDYQGAPEVAEKDFEEIVEFCLAKNGLHLPKPKCADLATTVTRAGEHFDGSAAEAFVDGYHFLLVDEGPKLAADKALELLETIVAVSPKAVENFRLVFEYANEKSGLGLSREDSFEIAKKVAINTKIKVVKSM